MPRFTFRLEAVLQVRRLREELARQELATAESRWRTWVNRLAETRRLLERTLAVDRGSAFDLAANLYLDCYRAYLGRRGREEEQAVVRYRKEVEKRREHVVEARRERLVLERLKERRHLEFRAAEAAREIKELDDLGSQAFRFRRSTAKERR